MSYADAVLADSPRWYFRFNEAGGQYARSTGADTSTGFSPGNPAGATTSATGLSSGYTGIARDGGSFLLAHDAGMYVSAVLPSATTVFTAEFWLAVGTTTWGGPGQVHRIWGLGGEPATVFLRLNNVLNNLDIQVVDSGSGTHLQSYTHSPGFLQDGGFHHVVLAVGASVTTLYVDGAALSPTLSLTPASWSFGAIGGLSMTLGVQAPSTTTRASIFYSEFAFYQATLGSTQVAAHYAARELNILPRWRTGLAGVCT